jgi:hypothetical protein
LEQSIQGAELDGKPVHDQVLEVMLSALKEHEKAKKVDEEALIAICLEAINEDRINDLSWLETKLDMAKQVSGDSKPLNEGEEWKEVLAQIEPSKPRVVETEDDLREILQLHEAWIHSVLDPKRQVSEGRANLRGANLQGFDLRYRNLSCADLREVNLMGANLEGANLVSAKLQSANLQGANLCKAKLRKANLSDADLRDSEIDDADWRGAILTGTILEGKDFEKSISSNPATSPQI